MAGSPLSQDNLLCVIRSQGTTRTSALRLSLRDPADEASPPSIKLSLMRDTHIVARVFAAENRDRRDRSGAGCYASPKSPWAPAWQHGRSAET